MDNQFQVAWTMKEFVQFLQDNPLGIEVYKGDSTLKNQDYIFFDVSERQLIGYDDGGTVRTQVTINVYCRKYADRDTTVDYLQSKLIGRTYYTRDVENNFFVATLERGILIG